MLIISTIGSLGHVFRIPWPDMYSCWQHTQISVPGGLMFTSQFTEDLNCSRDKFSQQSTSDITLP